jgi:hypothetical protein
VTLAPEQGVCYARDVASELARRVRPPSPRAAVAIGAAALLLIVLYMGRGALGPFILGALLVYILDPVVGWLTRRGLRRGLAILIVYGLVIVVLIEGVTLLFGPLVRQVIDFLDDLPALLESVEGQLSELVLIFDQLQLPRILHDFIASFIESLASGGGGFDIGSLAPSTAGRGRPAQPAPAGHRAHLGVLPAQGLRPPHRRRPRRRTGRLARGCVVDGLHL